MTLSLIEDCARAAYAAFYRVRAEQFPAFGPGGHREPPSWDRLEPRLKICWLEAAYAARKTRQGEEIK